jgi:hypothetical protein
MPLKKNRIFVAMAVSFVILLLGSALAAAAVTGEPGSADDPLVTRSYLESQLKALSGGSNDGATDAPVEKYSRWQVMDLAPGQRLEAKAGTELIVRAGQTVVLDPSGSGIPDVTAGTNITVGKVIALDHLLIIPRTDGRGINARSKTIVMYKGEVEVK